MELLSALVASSAVAAVVGWLIRPRSRSRDLARRIETAKLLSSDLASDSQHPLTNSIRIDTLRLAALSLVRWNVTTTTAVRYVALLIVVATLATISVFSAAIADVIETYKTALTGDSYMQAWIAVVTSALLVILAVVGIRYAGGTLLTSARERWVEEQIRAPRADEKKPGRLAKLLFAPLDDELFPRYEAPRRLRKRL